MSHGLPAAETRVALQARVSLPFTGSAPEWIQWMPAGTHTISATRRGKPVTVTIAVNPAGAARIQAALREHLSASKQRPYFDFDHKGEAASAWPLEFAWREAPEPGIYARVEWSDAGAAAITGRQYRAFSPKFYDTASDPAEVDGAPLNMGGLVNDPAFKEIAPIWARHAAASAETPTTPDTTSMDLKTETELAAANARIAELTARTLELQAAAEDAEAKDALAAKDVELAETRTKLAALEAEGQERRRRDAQLVVASAVARGAIAAKDEATQKHWLDLCVADPKNCDLLAKQAGRPAVSAGRITTPRVEITAPDTNDVLKAYLACSGPSATRDRGALYQRELSPRFAKGENVFARLDRAALAASNTLGTLVNAMVSQRTLELVYSYRPMLKNVVTDFSDEVKAKGDTVKTRTVGLPTMQDFGGTVSETADADVTVTLDLMKEVKFTYAAAEIAGTSRDLVAEHAEALAVALGNGIVDAMAALITESNFSTTNKQTIKAAASVDFTTLTGIAKAMNTLGVPAMGRFCWVNADVAEALANDELMIGNFDKSPLVSAYSHWTNVKGFKDIWEFPALPANSCNLIGFFAHRNALIVSARIPNNPTTVGGGTYNGRIMQVTDPISGLSVLVDEYSDNSWNVTSRLVSLFGVDIGNATCGHTLVSAA